MLHHAVEAGDDAAVVEYGPSRAVASRAGAHRQAVSSFAYVLARGARVPPEQLARLAEAYAWALQQQPVPRRRRGRGRRGRAVGLAGGDTKLVRCLVTLTRQLWLTERTSEALRRRGGPGAAEPQATPLPSAGPAQPGGGLVLVDREPRGSCTWIALEWRRGSATTSWPPSPSTTTARPGCSSATSAAATSCSTASSCRALANHEYVMRGYYNLGEGLWRLGRYDEALAYIDQAEAYAATETSRRTPTWSMPAGCGGSACRASGQRPSRAARVLAAAATPA